MKKEELYWNEDHSDYAVLVSHGFGAGWSTWSTQDGAPHLACDKRIVEFWLAHKDNKEWMRSVDTMLDTESPASKEAASFFKSIGYHNCPYMGGFNDIKLHWVPANSKWRIEEYDGAESLMFEDDYIWFQVD